MSDEEEPAPSAPGSDIGNDNAASDAEQASSAHKRRKTGLTKCDDEYTVSKRREALSAKANTGKFTGLRAERILELMHKAESERRARFSVQKAETTSKQPAANACLHTTALPTGKAKVTSSILCEAMEDSENS